MKLKPVLNFIFLASVFMSHGAGAGSGSKSSSSLYGWESLSTFYSKLDQLQKSPGSDTVLIIQIGDSHSAADHISGSWRNRLQLRYGNSGRGVMAPGVIYKGYMPRQITVTQSPGWEVQTYLDYLSVPENIPFFGLSGYRLSTETNGASLRLTTDQPGGFDKVSVCGLMQPNGGTFELISDGLSARFSLKSAITEVACFGLDSPVSLTSVNLIASEGPVVLTSISSRNSAGGVALSNLGVVGAKVPHFGLTNDAAVSAELNFYRPDLLVFAFGTNDGFESNFDEDRFKNNLRAQITRLKRMAPNVPILLIGAPDAARRKSKNSRWNVPHELSRVRKIQKTVALEMGLAFWDWSEKLGGPSYVREWSEASPAKMATDRVHFTKAGAEEIARMLDEDIMSASGN